MERPADLPLLEVENLSTSFFTEEGVVAAVDGVSFSLGRGRTLALVGESGSGTSVTAYSIAITQYGVKGLPTTYLVGPDGKIAGCYEGYLGENDRRTEEGLAHLGVTIP